MKQTKPVVAIAGASGYIGHHVRRKLKGKVHVIGLSRNGDHYQDTEDITWRSCDLFSVKDTEKAVEGADIAVYLAQALKPSAKLTQGNVADRNAILSDNFAQAAKAHGVKKVICLTGPMPNSARKLSSHLKSRLEVERILRAYGTPVTAVRTGLVAEKPEQHLFVTKDMTLKQDVRSVQRIIVPAGNSAHAIAKYYVRWLQAFLRPWVRTEIDEKLHCTIGFLRPQCPLLELTYSPERSTADQALYDITDGLLTDKKQHHRGRMEFRKIPASNEAIIAIHDYVPALPWFIYRYTQAIMHRFVMACFQRHMKQLGKRELIHGKFPEKEKGLNHSS
ncbi:NAD(P)H-binding protein [Virgibacillus salexigens]|uniref:NAD(P)-binding domain-containing protein n=1 Tax=Virgibacillus kapii TaxID=1638645 RepID=A0ABQ2DI27_9BACI|nr:NAD(P)H-binding protein [Virgibacillus kapii]GGJ55557.1 hypothetical protein GCM10007111_17280 [Virgibacillus kapii]